MFLVRDIHESRVYQEAMEEGAEKERQRFFQEKLGIIAKMAAKKIPAANIADYLELDVDLVRQEIAKIRP
jgi:predicted transposase YdaD